MIRTIRACLVVLFSLTACEPLEEEPGRTSGILLQPDGNGLKTALPAKVSLSFTVLRANGEPVSNLTADDFEIREDGSPISRLESQQTVSRQGEGYRMDSLLMLDMSGSLLRTESFSMLLKAAGRYVEQVLAHTTGQQIAIMTFDGRAEPTLIADFSNDKAKAYDALDKLGTPECRSKADCAGYTDRQTCAGFRCVDDSTNLNGAVVSGLDLLSRRLGTRDGVRHKGAAMVVFTDGSDQAGRVAQDAMVLKVVQSQAKVFAVALGNDVNRVAIDAIGKNGTFTASSGEDLELAFNSAASRVIAEANKTYVLEYCSPRRTGKHQLLVNVRSNGETGSFVGAFDATGFTSGCSL